MRVSFSLALILAACRSAISQQEYYITIVDNLGRHIDVGFSAESNLRDIAERAVDEAKLEGGEGCKSRDCVASLLESAMKNKLGPSGSLGLDVYEKAKIVYEKDFRFYENRQESEESARMSGVREENKAVNQGVGVFTKVPCVPPWCDFECSALVSKKSLDKDALLNLNELFLFMHEHSSRGDVCNIKSHPQYSPFFEERPSESVFSTWPPKPRQCRATSSGMTSLVNIRPIWIAIPEERVVDCVPRKSQPFASLVGASYRYDASQEHEYHRKYRTSYFGATQKKSGWDCMRHLEILASGSIPWFTDFDECRYPPAHVLSHLPLSILAQYQNYLLSAGIVSAPRSSRKGTTSMDTDSRPNGHIDFQLFNHSQYLKIAESLLAFTRSRLTTKALAEYILTSSGHGYLLGPVLKNETGKVGRVLLLCSHGQPDYVKDMAIHGLRSVLGSRFIDYIRPRHLYRLEDYDIDIKQPSHISKGRSLSSTSEDEGDIELSLNEIEMKSRQEMYGLGYTFAHSLPHMPNPPDDASTTTTTTTVTSFTTTTTTTTTAANQHLNSKDDSLLVAVEEVSHFTETYTVTSSNGDDDEGIIRSKSHILNGIVNKKYDLVIYGSIARGMPFLDEVISAGYGEENHLIFIDGEDENTVEGQGASSGEAHGKWGKDHAKLASVGQLYIREMPAGCP